MSAKEYGVEIPTGLEALAGECELEEAKKVVVETKTIVVQATSKPQGTITKVAKPTMPTVHKQEGRPAVRVEGQDVAVEESSEIETAIAEVSPGETKELEFADGSTGMVVDPCPPEDYIPPTEAVKGKQGGWLGARYFSEYAKLLVIKGRGLRIFMSGPRGTGKTTGAEWRAKEIGLKIIKVNAHHKMTAMSLFGHARIRTGEGGGDFWEPGPLYYCVKYGCMLFVDEMTNMSEAAQIGLNPLLDSLKAGYTNLYTGERLTWNQPVFIAASNEGYAGNKSVQEALRDRFRTIYCGYLPEDDEVALISGREPDVCRTQIRKMVQCANAIRLAASGMESDGQSMRSSGPIRFDMSPRALLDAAESMAVGEDPNEAWRTAVLGRVGFNARSAEAMEVVKQISITAGFTGLD